MKITKTQLRQIIKEELQTELFGFGGKKKAAPKARAAAQGPGPDQKMLQRIVEMSDRKEFIEAFKENPRLYVGAVRLAANGTSAARLFLSGHIKEYYQYVQKLQNRLENSSFVTGKRNTEDPMGDLAVRFLTDESEADNKGARAAYDVDSGQRSTFGFKGEKFVSFVKKYMKSEMDPDLGNLAALAKKGR
tara:strand:- start:369 stop:938 length:570 start_codon:yes stop_codon:yes gene_type:complete